MKYDPNEETSIQQSWEEQQTFKFNENTKKKVYSIDTPPPTMSGKMHIGHACSFAQQDMIARFKRMQGFEVFYPFGTDDNGLPTEKLVQKEKKVLASKMEREEFISLCNSFVNETRPEFISDWKRIGMSCDFDICYSTISDHSRKIAQKTFLDLYKQDRAYRKEAPVIWDTFFQSAIAQAELEYVEKKTFFNDIVFKADDGTDLIIATTRPELLPACVAIFAHPDDKRYQQYFGKTATSPLFNVRVPILPDEKADPEKGTGIVMCCTFGDQTDIEWYKKHKLPLKMAITKDGKMNDLAGKYEGMKIEDARKEIIQDLKDANLLINQKEIVHSVNVGERSGRPVEIINSKQWYVSYLDKREDFLKSSEELIWHPPFMKHRLDNWIKGLNWDWSISRQRHYGVPIPVWYDAQGNTYVADETQLPVDPLKDRPLSAPEGVELIPETDVFDTWFTSGSSPFLAADYFKDKPIYKQLFPMDLRPQAHDIINFWLFYTMAKTQMIHGVNPWKHVAISGYVLASNGEKMSKSKGNTISPQVMIEKYSADALRYWAASAKLGEDISFQEKELVTGKKLVTKIWNAARFAAMHLEDYKDEKPKELLPIDEWMLQSAKNTIKEVTEQFEALNYSKARQLTDTFFWDMCDNYLEIVKDRLYKPEIYGDDARVSGQYALKTVFIDVLKLYAPLIPFITEKTYKDVFQKSESIHTSEWPTGDYPITTELILEQGTVIVDLISAIRRFKAESGKSLKTEIETLILDTDAEHKIIIEKMIGDLKGTTKTKTVAFEPVSDRDLEIDNIQAKIIFVEEEQ